MLQRLEASPCTHFVILLRDHNNMKFRGLYEFDFEANKASVV